MTGSSTEGIKTVLHPVSDLAAAKAVYSALLGIAPQADSSFYVGFDAAGQHGPEDFYRRLGFHPTGEYNEGETVAERLLAGG